MKLSPIDVDSRERFPDISELAASVMALVTLSRLIGVVNWWKPNEIDNVACACLLVLLDASLRSW